MGPALDSLTARELADTDEARQPFWSPDGSALGFFTSSDLRRIGVSGGPAAVIARAPDPRGGTWGPDGAIVFTPNSVGPLYLVNAAGGMPRPLTTLADGEPSHRWPEFLPDGRTLLYFGSGRSPGAYVTTVDLPDETTRLIDSTSHATYAPGEGNRAGSLLWVARNVIMSQPFDPGTARLSGAPSAIEGTDDVATTSATNRSSVSVSRNGSLLHSTAGSRYQLAWFERDGTRRETVGAIAEYIGVGVSPDGREALVTIRDDVAADGDLWRIDLATGARSRATSEGGGWWAVWGPGNQIAFTSLRDRETLRALNTRGAGAVQTLSTSAGQMYPSDWSPDGTHLVFTANAPDTSTDIWALNLTGERTAVPLMRSRFSERHAQFSPDGHWLAFTSNETGRDDVYIQSFPDPGTRRLVSSEGGAYPRWSASGGELFYRSPDGLLIMIPVRVGGSGVEIGAPTTVMRMVDAAGVHPYPYDVGRDGRILAMTPPLGDRTGVSPTLRTNWRRASTP